MKYLFSFLAIILIAVIAGLLAYDDSGYVLFGRGHTTMEMSLSLFLVLLLLSYLLGYLLVRFLIGSWNMPHNLRGWRSHRQMDKARKSSLQGLIQLSQGQWKKAEKLLTRGIKNSDLPLLNYLSAARAAQKQNAPDRRDHYLALAHQSMPEADFSVKLTQAELQFAHGQYEQALATLVHLHSLQPKHPHIMVLLTQLYQELKSWPDLKKLLPELYKHKVFDHNRLLQIEKQTYTALFQQQDWKGREAELDQLWHELSRELKKDPELIRLYSQRLIELEKQDEAEALLRHAIRHAWQPVLVHLYGKVKSSHPDKQLSFAESLSKDHDNNPVLLLTLGRLCMANDLWGKARAYLEASVGNRPMSESYKELGLLMEYLNEPALAAEYFKKGLFLCKDETVNES